MNASRSLLPGLCFAGASTVLATMARLALHPVLGSQHPYGFFSIAVMLAAWFVGLRWAVLTLLLGALSAAYFFVPPDNSLAIVGAANQIGFALYFVVALTGVILIERLRRQRREVEELVESQATFLAREQAARADAEDARQRLAADQQEALAQADQLETVQEELVRANEALRRQQDELQRLAEALQRQQRESVQARAGTLLESVRG